MMDGGGVEGGGKMEKRKAKRRCSFLGREVQEQATSVGSPY